MDNTPFSQSAAAPGSADDTLPEELQVIARYYAQQPVPQPSQAETRTLMQHILVKAPLVAYERHWWEHKSFMHIFAVARWRVFLLGPWFWIIGVLVFLVATGILWCVEEPYLTPQAGTIPVSTNFLIVFLVLLFPLSAVMSIAYALRTYSPGLRAVEASCPVNFVQATMGMALIVLAFDCLLGLLVTLGLALVNWAPFWVLLLAWLAPLLLLTAISLPLALLYNVRVAALVGGLPWLVVGFIALAQQNAHNVVAGFFSLPQSSLSLSSHLIVIAFSLVFLVALFVSAPRWQRFCTF